MTAWKYVERQVARLTGGVRSWDTDIDVIVPTEWPHGKPPLADEFSGGELLGAARAGAMLGWGIEVKHLTSPTVAEIERFLEHNAKKLERLGVSGRLINALVIKRKAGIGTSTPYLLVVPISEFDLGGMSTYQEEDTSE